MELADIKENFLLIDLFEKASFTNFWQSSNVPLTLTACIFE